MNQVRGRHSTSSYREINFTGEASERRDGYRQIGRPLQSEGQSLGCNVGIRNNRLVYFLKHRNNVTGQ